MSYGNLGWVWIQVKNYYDFGSGDGDLGYALKKKFPQLNLHCTEGDNECEKICSDLYKLMNKNKLKVLYDDTDERAGAKLARADLIGLPHQIIIGPKGIKEELYDLKCRKSGEVSRLSYNELLNFVQTNT